MNYDAFSHGQIKSKLWLCEKIEPHLVRNNQIVILGGWYNVLAFMLMTRNIHNINKITSIDIDSTVKPIADKVCELWRIEGSVENITGDANNITVSYDTVINCSSEHMSTEWFEGVKMGSVVCIQSSDVVDTEYPWLVTNPSPTIDSFKEKYKLSTTLFCDTLRIQNGAWGYNRFMIIGIK